ncbi:MAG: aldo/keto reductase [Polyangiaceae bacterium]|nr:aldo/keto reductase [Polyangiaceae bacterium]
MSYRASAGRYGTMPFQRCGRSGLLLPRVSLGLWHNFGAADSHENAREMLLCAFDLGIAHFDLANNYGPPPGSAEQTLGRVLATDLGPYRDELVISTKAGYDMWPGPYGDFGSRKYLLSSLERSLKRMGLEWVDIFYHHRPDPATPLEETMMALDQAVRSGKALYVGLSNYGAEPARRAFAILRELGTPCLIHQPSYSMLDRWVEPELLGLLAEEGVGCIAFSPLARGVLTERYLHGIPPDSRAAGPSVFLNPADLTPELLARVGRLAAIAARRGQSLAQMALGWVLRQPALTSVVIGASRSSQIVECAQAAQNLRFDAEELAEIDTVLGSAPA